MESVQKHLCAAMKNVDLLPIILSEKTVFVVSDRDPFIGVNINNVLKESELESELVRVCIVKSTKTENKYVYCFSV